MHFRDQLTRYEPALFVKSATTLLQRTTSGHLFLAQADDVTARTARQPPNDEQRNLPHGSKIRPVQQVGKLKILGLTP
jgi:hypothetical protein